MEKQLIYVGSTSEHKLRAVCEACAELGIEADVLGVKTSSGVREQPIKTPENDEILEGATNRAIASYKTATEEHCHDRAGIISIGIENGVAFAKSKIHAIVYDFAHVVVMANMSNNGGRFFFAQSAGHSVNYGDVEEARSRGFDKHTVASVTRERTGCDETDATPHYTGGRMTRVDLLKQAVKLALCQWLATKEGAK